MRWLGLMALMTVCACGQPVAEGADSDAGTSVDAGHLDAGPLDAGPVDAGCIPCDPPFDGGYCGATPPNGRRC